MVLANKLDSQFARLGLDRGITGGAQPGARSAVQLSAHRGEKRGPRHDYPGYDPALQGLTGIMMRFGAGRLPHVSWHRLLRGLSLRLSRRVGGSHRAGGAGAPPRRTRRLGRSPRWRRPPRWSSCCCSRRPSRQRRAAPTPPAGRPANGSTSCPTGGSSRRRHAICPAELAPMTVADALADLAARGINAVPVQTMRELADRHRAKPTRTVRFEKRERDGWTTECFAPSWFAFDGEPAARPAASGPHRRRCAGDPRRAGVHRCGCRAPRSPAASSAPPSALVRACARLTPGCQTFTSAPAALGMPGRTWTPSGVRPYPTPRVQRRATVRDQDGTRAERLPGASSARGVRREKCKSQEWPARHTQSRVDL